MSKTIAPAAINALKEALTCAYWYKSDLRSFLQNAISDPAILARVNWDDYKRNIVATVIDYLARDQATYQGDLLRLMSEVANIQDFSHLEKLEDGKAKAASAKRAVAALEKLTGRNREIEEEQKQAEANRQAKHEERLRTKGVRERLEQLQKEFFGLLSEKAQRRGYQLEKLLRELFDLFDLDPKASFRLTGEQIDGAFTFEATDFLLEAKWQDELVSIQALDAFSGKLTRKLENTLGLFLSINGFSEDAVRAHSTGRRLMLLMDGSDLMAVLEGRIDLVQLLLRKRRAAAQTGNIYVKIHEIL
jgi:hypothetical protein